jgi:hypothetical protein
MNFLTQINQEYCTKCISSAQTIRVDDIEDEVQENKNLETFVATYENKKSLTS